MRKILGEARRTLRSSWRWLVSQDDHQRHSDRSRMLTSVWEIIRHHQRAGVLHYIPKPRGQHRHELSDTTDLTIIMQRLEAEKAGRERQRLMLAAVDANRRARLASYALTSNTLHNTDTGYLPAVRD